jgi:hypothetical protein
MENESKVFEFGGYNSSARYVPMRSATKEGKEKILAGCACFMGRWESDEITLSISGENLTFIA